MIAKLRGVLDSLGDGWAVVDVGGVGYLTYCSAGTLASLPQRGQEGEPHHRDGGPRRPHPSLRLRQRAGARLVSPAANRAERRRAARARDPGRIAGNGARRVHRRAGQGRAHPRAGGGAQACGAHPERTQRTRCHPCRVQHPRPTTVDGTANADAIAALVNLGYRPTEAHGAVSGAARTLGAEATGGSAHPCRP